MQREATAARTLELMDIAKRIAPWNRIGTNFDPTANISVPDAFNQAGLDWSVSKQPLKVTHRGEVIVIPGKFALMNDANGDVLDVVSERYEPIQNTALACYLDPARAWGPVETVGSNGTSAFVVFRGGEFDITSRNLRVGDTVRHYTAVRENKQLGAGLGISKTILRLACINGNIYPAAENIFGASVKHTKGANSIVAYMAEVIAVMAEVDTKFANSCQKLADTLIPDHEADYIFAAAIPMPKVGPDLQRLLDLNIRGILDGEGRSMLSEAQERYQNALEAAALGRNTCRAIYEGECADQGIAGSAWGGLQAVVTWSDHSIVAKMKARAGSAVYGKHADAKVAAFKTAMKFSEN